MSRRKGEQPVIRHLDQFTPLHPVAHAVRTGDSWFIAWLNQKSTPYARLSRITGIPVARFPAISLGGEVSRAELKAFARAWCISVEGLIASMPDPSIVVE